MMKETNQPYKKLMVTVNGEPVGKEIWIDRITYAPVHVYENVLKPSLTTTKTS